MFACELDCSTCADACEPAYVEKVRLHDAAEENRYRELVRTDAAFAEVEREYLETKIVFLGLFADDTEQDIDDYFGLTQSRSRWNFTDGDGSAYREQYMEEQKRITRYMSMVIGNYDRPLPLFYLLVEGASFFRYHDISQDDFEKIAFSKTRPLPGGGEMLEGDFKRSYHDNTVVDFSEPRNGYFKVTYEIHPFGDETWGIFRSEGTSQVVLMRHVKWGKISLYTLPSFAMDELYPSGDGPANPYSQKQPPADMAYVQPAPIATCDRRSYYRIDTSHAPPTITAIIDQQPEERITWRCVAECTQPYVWAAGAGYRPGDMDCLSSRQWGVSSPWRDDTLIPFEDAYRALLQKDSFLAHHDAALAARWWEYAVLFADGSSRTLVEDIHREWLLTRQVALHSHRLKDDKAFADAVIAYDKPVFDHMKLVASLMKTPDARLLTLLDPLHRLIELRTKQRLGLSTYFVTDEEKEPDERAYIRDEYPAALQERIDLLRKGDIAPLSEEEAREKIAIDPDYPFVTLTGVAGGDAIAYRSKRHYGSRDFETRAYDIRRAKNGDIWGLSTWHADFEAGHYGGITHEEARITVIRNGKIHLVSPELPSPTLFPGGGKEPTAQQAKKVFSDEGIGFLPCILRPVFAVDTTHVPFDVRAVLVQTNTYNYDGTWECTPQCALSYRWNAAKLRYERGKPECLPAGKWGVKSPGE